jgi:hypothetical protein
VAEFSSYQIVGGGRWQQDLEMPRNGAGRRSHTSTMTATAGGGGRGEGEISAAGSVCGARPYVLGPPVE